MSEELKYIDYDGALEVYGKTVAASGGGLQGVKDEGGIRKVLDFVQNDLYYPTFVEKLTYLVFGLCTGHYFEDSNKPCISASRWAMYASISRQPCSPARIYFTSS